MGIMTLFQASRPEASLWTSVTFNFGLAYFSIATTLNILLTLLICARLLIHQRQMRANSGPKYGLLPYQDIISMLIESSAVYAVTSAIFIGTYAAGHAASTLFLPILSQTQVRPPPDYARIYVDIQTDNRTIVDYSTSCKPEGLGILQGQPQLAS
jgi:hypothetical protein